MEVNARAGKSGIPHKNPNCLNEKKKIIICISLTLEINGQRENENEKKKPMQCVKTNERHKHFFL